MDSDIILENGQWFVYLYNGPRMFIFGPYKTERDANLALNDRLADAADYSTHKEPLQ
jgi:hypothetical protein